MSKMMPLSLSWIEPDTLSDVLAKAGLSRLIPTSVPDHRAAVSSRADDLWSVSPVSRRPAKTTQGVSFSPPAGASLQARLKAFVSWAIERSGCRRLFVVDQEGLILMEKHAEATLVAASSSILSLMDRVDECLDTRTSGSLAIDLEGGLVLQLIQAETALGKYALGCVVSEPLRRAQIDEFRAALIFAMSEDE